MMWVLGVIAVGIIATGVFLASDKLGSMPELVDDNPVPRVPEGDFTADSLGQVRFAVVMRGYAPHQVDDLLDRAATSIRGDGLARPMTGADIRAVAFNVVGRGYHMGQVDLVLDKLAWQFDRPDVTAATVAVPTEQQPSDTAGSGPAPTLAGIGPPDTE